MHFHFPFYQSFIEEGMDRGYYYPHFPPLCPHPLRPNFPPPSKFFPPPVGLELAIDPLPIPPGRILYTVTMIFLNYII